MQQKKKKKKKVKNGKQAKEIGRRWNLIIRELVPNAESAAGIALHHVRKNAHLRRLACRAFSLLGQKVLASFNNFE